MSKLNLKTAEERAAEIRAESQAVEEAKAAKRTEKDPNKSPVEQTEPEPNYAELARMEEARCVQLRAESDALQAEMDPYNRPQKRTETKPDINLSEILSRHDNAQDTLN